jgi:Txe/YoeB family toxin of Txe-Axe toxin-antitoxin module
MTVEFREKALMAYETMSSHQKEEIDPVLQSLTSMDHSPFLLTPLAPEKLKEIKLDNIKTWVAAIDQNIRLLYQKTEQGFLIIDIINLDSLVSL